ncbi:hypothetical protein bcgnr5378_07340 [Bacillus cereus]|uniref:Uncharacterized protein n=1 Tax=Bacillus cereus TaxID=1396 RepID=A0A164NY26_BACCE|nr:hypothetical protein [Bacillus cereus]KZD65984.1 hypothetical protein B4088_2741 [Bacillus cereus]
MKYLINVCIVSAIFALLMGLTVLIPNEESVDNDNNTPLQEAVILEVSGTGIAYATNYTVAIVQINGEIHNVNIEGLEVGNIKSKQELIGRTILVYESSDNVFPYTAKEIK